MAQRDVCTQGFIKEKIKTKLKFEKPISFYKMFIGESNFEPIRPLKNLEWKIFEIKCNNTSPFLILTQEYVYWFERERERETSMWKRDIDQLPPIGTPTRGGTCNLGMCPDRNQTCNLLVYGKMLQPTDPPGQGMIQHFYPFSPNLKVIFFSSFRHAISLRNNCQPCFIILVVNSI